MLAEYNVCHISSALASLRVIDDHPEVFYLCIVLEFVLLFLSFSNISRLQLIAMFSKTLPVLLAMASMTLAKPVTAIPGETQEIQVALSINKESSLSSITAWNKDKSATLGHSCSTKLSTGTFEATPIRFDVDATGSGSVHIGSHSYTVHSNPEFSGGITCSRMVSVAETYVACTLLVPTELKLRSLETRKLEDCFHGQGHEFEAMSAAMARNVVQPIEVLLAQNQAETHLSANLTRRQKGGCDTTTYSTRKEGDGDPHQTNLNIQVTVSLFLFWFFQLFAIEADMAVSYLG